MLDGKPGGRKKKRNNYDKIGGLGGTRLKKIKISRIVDRREWIHCIKKGQSSHRTVKTAEYLNKKKNIPCKSRDLRKESRLRVFENRILRRIFGPKRDENGEWSRLHNEELHSLYRSLNILNLED